MSRRGLALLVILLIAVAALVLAARAVLGGGAAGAARLAAGAKPTYGGAGGLLAGAPRLAAEPAASERLRTLGDRLGEYARALGPRDVVGTHPLGRGRYAPADEGADARVGGAARPRARRAWTAYETWDELRQDKGATAAYFAQRAAVLRNPALDWGPVLAVLRPLLDEDREHIGILNLDPDGRTLHIAAVEPSPVRAGATDSATTFASVPAELVAKYGGRPGLILFHTHPADPRANPLPSSHDLSAAIHFGAAARFAASAVVSRYGAILYGLDWDAYRAINAAPDWRLAALSLSHDVVAAHEAVRSWAEFTLEDYLAFYPRHRLFVAPSPSPEMVGDARRLRFVSDVDGPADLELIAEHQEDIRAHLAAAGGRPARGARARLALAPPVEPKKGRPLA